MVKIPPAREVNMARRSEALWKKIRKALESDIDEGRIPPGERLATEHEMAARFGVNRHTVRRAVADLEAAGVLRVIRGSGIYVQERIVDYKVGRRTRFSTNLADQNRSAGGVLLKAETVPAPPDPADALGLPEGQPLCYLEIAGEMDGRRITCSHNYFPCSRFEGLADIYRETLSITTAFKTMGLGDYFRKTTRVTAQLPDSHTALALNIPRSRPVLVTKSINVDTEGRPIQYTVCHYAGDWVQLVFEP